MAHFFWDNLVIFCDKDENNKLNYVKNNLQGQGWLKYLN